MKIQLINYKADQELQCQYLEHLFHLERNTNDKSTFGYWWAEVKNNHGETCLADWIDDSNGFAAHKAFQHACSALELPCTSDTKTQLAALLMENNSTPLTETQRTLP